MDNKQREHLLLKSILGKAGLLNAKGVPDFDKLAGITGHQRESLKVLLAPTADTPRWVRLILFLEEQWRLKNAISEDYILAHHESWSSLPSETLPDGIMCWVESLLEDLGFRVED